MRTSNITEPVLLILILLAFFITFGMINPWGELNAGWYSLAMAGGVMVLPPIWLTLAVLFLYLIMGLPYELQSGIISD